MFFNEFEKQSFTPIQNNLENYSFVQSCIVIFTHLLGDRKAIPTGPVTGIPQI
jgi:hypothetical protein